MPLFSSMNQLLDEGHFSKGLEVGKSSSLQVMKFLKELTQYTANGILRSYVSSFFIEGRFGQHITVKYFKIVKYFRIPQYIHLYHLTTFPYFLPIHFSRLFSWRICLTILLFTTFFYYFFRLQKCVEAYNGFLKL